MRKMVGNNDYYPFGMLVPQRNYSSPEYRYGYQGQEKDDEIKGAGNSLNYKFRMHDPRVGRFFAVDPLTAKYPHYAPYSFSGNKVIAFVELEGMEERIAIWNNYNEKFDYFDKSQMDISDWNDLTKGWYDFSLTRFHSGSAFFYGYEQYLHNPREKDQITPKYGTLYVSFEKDFTVFEFSSENLNLKSTTKYERFSKKYFVPLRVATRKISDFSDKMETGAMVTTLTTGGTSAEVTGPVAAFFEVTGTAADVTSLSLSILLLDKKGAVTDALNIAVPLGVNKLFGKKIAEKIIDGVSEQAQNSKKMIEKMINKIVNYYNVVVPVPYKETKSDKENTNN
jgi:RHS repeat-associated protein